MQYCRMTLGDTHVEAYSACHRPSKHVLLRWFLLLTLSSGGCWLSFPLFSGLSDIIYIYMHMFKKTIVTVQRDMTSQNS